MTPPFSEMYQNDIAQQQSLNEKKETSPPNWNNIRALSKHLKSAVSVNKAGAETAVSPSRKRSGVPTGPRPTSLLEKYQQLPPGKQLDVSKFDGVKGARQENAPSAKPGKISSSGKRASTQFPGLVSNNINSYVLALRVMATNDPNNTTADVTDPYASAIREVNEKLMALTVQPTPVTVAPTRAAAPLVPGRSLAPTPKPRPVPTVASPALRTVGGAGFAPVPAFRR